MFLSICIIWDMFSLTYTNTQICLYVNRHVWILVEGSLEVKLPTIWIDEKQYVWLCIFEYIMYIYTYLVIFVYAPIYMHIYIYIYLIISYLFIYLSYFIYIHNYTHVIGHIYIPLYTLMHLYICSYMRYSTVLQLIQDWSLWLPSKWTNQSSTRFQGAIGMPLASHWLWRPSPPQAPEAVETVDAEQDSQGNSNSGGNT